MFAKFWGVIGKILAAATDFWNQIDFIGFKINNQLIYMYDLLSDSVEQTNQKACHVIFAERLHDKAKDT